MHLSTVLFRAEGNLLQKEFVLESGDQAPTIHDFVKKVDKALSSFCFGEMVGSFNFGNWGSFISFVRGICK